MTTREILKRTYSKYKLSPLDVEILLSLALTKPKEYILAHPEKKITHSRIKKYYSFVERRSSGEPIAYIAEKKEFFGLDFIVDKNVLIPRPETELLVENAIEKIKNAKCDMPDTIIDVGTGSGNIIISIVRNLPSKIKNKTNFYAVDISKKSLEVAKKNAKKNKIDQKIKFIQSNLLEYFLKNNIKFENILIIANLPYVSPALYQKNKNGLKFEPKQALSSPEKGLAHYKELLKQTSSLLTAHCSLLLEISPEQKSEISRIQKRLLPKTKARFFKDLAGRWRVAVITSP